MALVTLPSVTEILPESYTVALPTILLLSAPVICTEPTLDWETAVPCMLRMKIKVSEIRWV
jgi:hypothetical protein